MSIFRWIASIILTVFFLALGTFVGLFVWGVLRTVAAPWYAHTAIEAPLLAIFCWDLYKFWRDALTLNKGSQ